MAGKRDERLAAFGLTPEAIAQLDQRGELPHFADGGAVDTAAGPLDPNLVASLSDRYGLGEGNGAPPITTLDTSQPFAGQSPILPGQGLPIGTPGGPPVPAAPNEAPGDPGASWNADPAAIGQAMTLPSTPGGASGNWSPDPNAPGAPVDPSNVVLHQPAGPAQPVMLPGMGMPAGGVNGADIPAAPAMKVPDLAGQQAANTNLAKTQATAAEEQAAAYSDAMDKRRAEDAAWKVTDTQYNGLLTAAREHAAKSPMSEWSTGHKILSAIALAMGSYGASMTHSPNFAMQIIDKQVDDEARSRQTALANLERQYGSAKDAHMAMRAGILENLRLDVDARAARSQSATVKAQGQVLSAGLAAKQTEAENSIKQNQFTNNLNRANSQIEQEKIGATLNNRIWEMQQKYGERYVPGMGVMRTDDDAKKAKDIVLGYQGMNDAVTTIEKLRNKYPAGTIPMGPDAALADRAALQLKMAAKAGLNLGTLSDSDIKLLEGLSVGDPLSLLSRADTVRAKLQAIRGDWNQRMDGMRGMAMIPEAGPSARPAAQLSTFKPVGAR